MPAFIPFLLKAGAVVGGVALISSAVKRKRKKPATRRTPPAPSPTPHPEPTDPIVEPELPAQTSTVSLHEVVGKSPPVQVVLRPQDDLFIHLPDDDNQYNWKEIVPDPVLGTGYIPSSDPAHPNSIHVTVPMVVGDQITASGQGHHTKLSLFRRTWDAATDGYINTNIGAVAIHLVPAFTK